MRGYHPSVGKQAASQKQSNISRPLPGRPVLQRARATDTEKLASLQGSAGNRAVLQMFRQADNKMPVNVQAKMEGALGSDFSDVRIHANSSKASEAGALAYTQGTDIHFAPGKYNPNQPGGQRLLGHELAHVVQQKAGRVAPTGQLASGALLNDSPALEQEADRLGSQAASAPDLGGEAIQRLAEAGSSGATSGSRDSGVMQRMPSAEQVKATLGQPKEHMKLFGKTIKQNSTHYRSYLDKLDTFDRFVDNHVVAASPGEIDFQLNQVMALYEQVEQVSDEYIRHNRNDSKDKKVVYIRKIREILPFEKTAVRSSAAEYKADPNKRRPPWKLLTSAGIVKLSSAMSTGATGKGGINSVEFFEVGPGKEGVFKATKDRILAEEELPPNATEAEKEVAFLETGVASHGGIDRNDAKLANRNVAMSRLDQLLGAGVIAKAEFALYNNGSGIVRGTFMEKAKGKEAFSVVSKLGEDIEQGREESFDMNEPAFQRALSRLNLIDALAMQVDRHTGNFYIDRDREGRTVGLTGIDNDMAFGTETNLVARHNNYHGLSRYVDKELAERILALKPADLAVIMEGLLSDTEIAALLERLQKLQAHLRQETTMLLDRDEWGKVDVNARSNDKGYAAMFDKPITAARNKAKR
ncbi:eCIS core domain-containing protein [Cohnella fermenti]|uniref:DUF4157 domain-containing protein n=1 Tax=Cohnella fermenti TaxID=2565925 RepID=A0A4S4BTG5_9BACL|nr:DUF4157 domain-containing protein [Cohnella fermenti]THF77585.1 DUF4157 domain-containing protein [Cohnella fermenti]